MEEVFTGRIFPYKITESPGLAERDEFFIVKKKIASVCPNDVIPVFKFLPAISSYFVVRIFGKFFFFRLPGDKEAEREYGN